MRRPGTYSIVARDPETHELGVAVQSHWFSVGSVVSWARAGVAAAAVQSVPAPRAGPALLDALARGEAPDDALGEVIAADDERGLRQTAVVGAQGQVAVHTGARCIPHAGDATGEGFSCQANMMLREGVPEAMAAAFTAATGPFAERLLAALDGGEAAGGDVRGRQSTAVLIVPAQGETWQRTMDLRVEDSPDPLAELRRLVVLHRAYELAADADELVAQGRHGEAGELFARAGELAPDNEELRFWAGLAAAGEGDMEGGLERVRAAIAASPRWGELLDRLGPDVAPGAPSVREALGR